MLAKQAVRKEVLKDRMGEDREAGDYLPIDPLTEREFGEVKTGKRCFLCGQS
jgi:hypothetical protein